MTDCHNQINLKLNLASRYNSVSLVQGLHHNSGLCDTFCYICWNNHIRNCCIHCLYRKSLIGTMLDKFFMEIFVLKEHCYLRLNVYVRWMISINISLCVGFETHSSEIARLRYLTRDIFVSLNNYIDFFYA